MPYIVATILTAVSAMIILLTRYTADDSSIKEQLRTMEVMFSMVDDFVNTYVESGESISDVNFKVLFDNGVLLSNAKIESSGNGTANETILTLPNNKVKWQLIPNKDDSSSYKLLVDFTQESVLMSKARFSESFIGREYCENDLFGNFEPNTNSFDAGDIADPSDDNFVNVLGSNSDGIFTCVVFK